MAVELARVLLIVLEEEGRVVLQAASMRTMHLLFFWAVLGACSSRRCDDDTSQYHELLGSAGLHLMHVVVIRSLQDEEGSSCLNEENHPRRQQPYDFLLLP